MSAADARQALLLGAALLAAGGCSDTTPPSGDKGPAMLAPQPGDLAIVELFPGTDGPGGQRWVELYNRTRSSVSLAGCTLGRRAEDDDTWDEQAITATGPVPPLGRLVLAAEGCAAFPGGTACAVCPAAAPERGGTWELRLSCPTPDGGGPRAIDGVACDLSEQRVPAGRSLALPEELFGQHPAETNDDDAAWCPAAATPTGDNACLASEGEGEGETGGGPGPGDLALVELYVRTSGDERQWVEVYGAAGQTVTGIEACRLEQYKLDQDPPAEVDGQLRAEEPLALAPGERLVLMKSVCEGPAGEAATCATFPNISLRSTKRDRLVLACPDPGQPGAWVEVDRIEYLLSEHQVATGQSLLFPDDALGQAPAQSNDAGAAWCAAPPSPGVGASCP